MTPPLTRQIVRAANATLDALQYTPRPCGRVEATYEVHGITVHEAVEPARRPA